ncbi:type VI secretion system baseplate subunit TssG [Sphingomonas cynarae]|uniref:Type VI secretion system baseplate subunit TssG n=1 Tax=Sphingomonas cynarae TaxID=930197 RepID=A0ABP7E5R8_9SPHN
MSAALPVSPADLPEGLRAEFFEAVRQVIAASGITTAGPAIGGPAIGGDVRPAAEPVRFVAMRGSRHPDAELGAATQVAPGGHVRMEAAFMGLTGPMGVMPDHYTELVVARDRARDEAFGAFVDLFNHRAISLFYRAWAKYRVPVGFGETKGSLTDPVSRALAALAGLTAPGEDPRILGAAGLLARRVRSPDALRRTLASLYDVPVEVIELEPRRIRIGPNEQTRLGGGKTAAAYARLATDAVLGATAIDVAGRFRVKIGPLARAQFDAFFDGSNLRERMITTIRQVAGPTANFDIQLILRRDAVPRTRTGTTTRLGQSSWLMHDGAEQDRSDAVLRCG